MALLISEKFLNEIKTNPQIKEWKERQKAREAEEKEWIQILTDRTNNFNQPESFPRYMSPTFVEKRRTEMR